MINWSDCSPLTKDEWLDFLNLGIPHLKEMESKNDWDFHINDFSFTILCNNFLCHAYHSNLPKEWEERLPKAKDLMTIWDLIDEIDWSQEEHRYKYQKENNENLTIYGLILGKIYKLTENLF